MRTPVQRACHSLGVLDCAVHEAKGRIIGEVVEVLLATGVGELVEHDNLVAALTQAHAHEVGADEAGTTADKQSHTYIISS